MPNAGLRKSVPSISGEPSPYGLLGCAIEVVGAGDVHELNGTDTAPQGCGPATLWQDCPEAGNGWTNPVTKPFDRMDSCTFEPFTATKGLVCSMIGTDQDEMDAAALEALRLGEQFAVEEWFMRRGLSWMANGNDLTPGAGALHVVSGIGALETWLAENYGGTGTIHVPVGVASLLGKNHQLDPHRNCPTTWAGNTVVYGGGYSVNVGPVAQPGAGAEAPAGEAWIYITPPVRIRRSPRELAGGSVPVSPDVTVNDIYAEAEATFVAEVACCTAAAVRVTLSACCP